MTFTKWAAILTLVTSGCLGPDTHACGNEGYELAKALPALVLSVVPNSQALNVGEKAEIVIRVCHDRSSSDNYDFRVTWTSTGLTPPEGEWNGTTKPGEEKAHVVALSAKAVGVYSFNATGHFDPKVATTPFGIRNVTIEFK